jgi:hypothetical protein
VHDITSLEERGIPGAFVASSEFEQAAAAQGRSLGFDPHAIYVRHPIQDRTDDEMVEIAEGALERVIAALCRQPPD